MKGVHGFRFRLLAVVALWFGLRLAYFNGYYVEDAPGYVTDASWAAIGQYRARHSLAFFDFWLNPLGRTHVRIVPSAAVSACDDIVHGSVVLTRSNPGWLDGAPAIRQSVARLPCLVQPPLHWRLVYDGYPERVFHVE